jgi:hypothetical protein
MTTLGVVGRRPSTVTDDRLEAALDLGAYEVLVSDATDTPEEQAEAALEAGISCVLWADANPALVELGERFAGAGRTLLVGANLGSGLAPCLAAHEEARTSEILDVSVAWTEPGRPLRRGEPIPFPDPVGARWARSREPEGRTRHYVAPLDGEWAAAMARVTTGTPDGVLARVVGVADLAPHLEALALTAAVMSVGEYGYGLTRPAERAEAFLANALDAGLDVATYSIESTD